jgi:serine phosphatase RsbU (regulator of sigma subunit)
VIVTDGITDAIEASGRVPMEVLISLLARREPASTAESVCDEIMREADRGARDGIQDDRTVVVFAIEAAGA